MWNVFAVPAKRRGEHGGVVQHPCSSDELAADLGPFTNLEGT